MMKLIVSFAAVAATANAALIKNHSTQTSKNEIDSFGAACQACRKTARGSCASYLTSTCYAANTAHLTKSKNQGHGGVEREEADKWMWAVNVSGGNANYKICPFTSRTDAEGTGYDGAADRTNVDNFGDEIDHTAEVSKDYTMDADEAKPADYNFCQNKMTTIAEE